MTNWRRGIRIGIWGTAPVAFLILAAVTAGSGAAPMHFKQNFHNATTTFPVTFPCTTETGNVTITYNGVIHVTILTAGKGAGTGWFTSTMTGTFSFSPDRSSGVSYTGKVTDWFGGSANLKNNVSSGTLNIHAVGSDGSAVSFHENTHITIVGLPSNPTVVVSFDKLTC